MARRKDSKQPKETIITPQDMDKAVSKPELDGTSHNKWVKWLQENGGPVKDLGGGAYQIGPEGPITGKGGVEMFSKCLAKEASAFTTKDPDKTEEE